MQTGEAFKILHPPATTNAPLPVSTAAAWYDNNLDCFLVWIVSQNTSEEATAECQGQQADEKELTFQLVPVQLSHKETKKNPFEDLSVAKKIVTARLGKECIPLCKNFTLLSARLSLDGTLLAVQITATRLLILATVVKSPESESMNQTDRKHQYQWMIELASGTFDPHLLNASEKDGNAARTFFNRYKSNQNNKPLAVLSSSKDTILKDGVVWSDHGGNSQDLVVVTTYSVLCYKVSLRRKQMSLTHSFPHSATASIFPLNPKPFTGLKACQVWWEPHSRSLTVGCVAESENAFEPNSNQQKGKGVFFIQTFFLHFSAKPPNMKQGGLEDGLFAILPRFELPPPDHIATFRASLSSLRNDVSDQRSEKELYYMTMISLNGRPYLIELFWSHSDSEVLKIVIYRLDRKTSNVRQRPYEMILQADDAVRTASSVLTSVLDNLICLSFPSWDIQIIIDLPPDYLDDSTSTYDNEIHMLHYQPLDRTDNGSVIFGQSSVLLSPTLLLIREESMPSHSSTFISDFSSCSGTIFPLSLSLEVLFAKVGFASKTKTLSFLLRRSDTSVARSLVVDIVHQAISSANMAECRLCLEQIAARQQSIAHPLPQAGRSLLFQCALLPSDAELSPYVFYDCRDTQENDKVNGDLFLGTALTSHACLGQQIVESCDVQATTISIPQQAIVRILVDEAASALGKPPRFGTSLSKATIARLEQILDAAVCYAAALESRSLSHRNASLRQERPCVELTCFIIAIFWRVGQPFSADYILRSYAGTVMNDGARDVLRLARVISCMAVTTVTATSFTLKLPQTKSETQEYGTNYILDATNHLLSAASDRTNDGLLVCHIIGRLLRRRQLLHAMDICVGLLLSSSEFPVPDEEIISEKNKPSLEAPTLSNSRRILILARRMFRGHDFFQVAALELLEPAQGQKLDYVDSLKSKQIKNGTCHSLLQSIYSFLLQWQPRCLQPSETADTARLFRQRIQQEEGTEDLWRTIGGTERMKRRSSWEASESIDSKSTVNLRNSNGELISSIASKYPDTLDRLQQRKQMCTKSVLHAKQLFGYPTNQKQVKL